MDKSQKRFMAIKIVLINMLILFFMQILQDTTYNLQMSLIFTTLPTMQISISSSIHNQTHHFLDQKCSTFKHLQQIHAHLIKINSINKAPSLQKLLSLSLTLSPQTTTLLSYAIKLFNHTPNKSNAVLYNTMLRGFINHDLPKLAIMTFVDMLEESSIIPDRFTFPSLLKASARSPSLINGKALHAQIVKHELVHDLYIQTTLILMYSSCRDCNCAREVFERMEKEKKNEVAFTSMINAYIKNQMPEQGLELFFIMQEEKGLTVDEVTLATAISACGELNNLEYGKKLCFHIKQSNMKLSVVLGTSIVEMYSKCGDLKLAREVFDAVLEKNVVCWSAMISGYSQNNQGNEALKLFQKMVKSSNVKPNEITVMAALAACAQTGNLSLGQWIHAYIGKERLIHTVGLMNSLIDMYCKCGKIDLAFEIFESMPCKDVISYNSMINGLALHGFGDRALNQFDLMQNEGIEPDDITFIGVLSACSHRGLVNEGLSRFKAMKDSFGIKPKLEHYGCMADLFSRAGMLDDVKRLITKMPMEPNGAVWGALLSGCRLHDNAELGEEAAKHLLELEPYNDANYVLLSNIFAQKKKWKEVKRVRLLMHKRGVRKKPGCSSIAINGDSHEFTVGDVSHAESEKIYAMLDVVNDKLSKAGYVAEITEVLLNIDEEEKADMLSQHSEKLAVCYGLIKTTPGDEIHILNNLRVCRDCHTALKLISEIFKRRITLRDRSRFHHFEGGVCSCNEFW